MPLHFHKRVPRGLSATAEFLVKLLTGNCYLTALAGFNLTIMSSQTSRREIEKK